MSKPDPSVPDAKKKVETLKEKVADFKNHMHAFSVAMRSLYVKGDSGAPNDAVQKYLALRDATRDDGEIYLKAILPLSKHFVQNVDDYFNNFAVLKYDQFVQCLKDLVDEATSYKAQAEVIINIHKMLITVLKKREDQATVVVQQLGELEKKYEEEYKKLMAEAKAKHNWAVGLACIPFIGAIVSPILAASGDSEAEEAKLDMKEAKMTEAGATLVKNSLLPALEDFIAGLLDAAGFFEVLISDIEIFISHGTQPDPTKRLYFFMMKGEAAEMKDNCDSFYEVLPDVETDFKAMPAPKNQDDVNQWIANEEKLIRHSLDPKTADELIKMITNPSKEQTVL